MQQIQNQQLTHRQKDILTKLRKAQARLQKKLNIGNLVNMTRRKKAQLLKRLRRYAGQLKQVGIQLPRTAFYMGMLTMLLSANQSQAQTFTNDPPLNPLEYESNPYKFIDLGTYPRPRFVDIDGDGDMDVFIGGATNGTVVYYKNDGNNTSPNFIQQTGANNPLDGVNVSSSSSISLADVDGDMDMDAVFGKFDGTIKYYRNDGSSSNPNFIEQTGTNNPFDGITTSIRPTISFADIDGDMDMDAVFGDNSGALLYYRNDGSSSNPNFIEQTGTNNPFDGVEVGSDSVPSFVDIDGDGDADCVIGTHSGGLVLLTNTIPSFTPIINIIIVGDATKSEYNNSLIFRFFRNISTDALTVHFSLSGTATKDVDYNIVSNTNIDLTNMTVNFPMGVDMVVNFIDDELTEADETIIVKLEAP